MCPSPVLFAPHHAAYSAAVVENLLLEWHGRSAEDSPKNL